MHAAIYTPLKLTDTWENDDFPVALRQSIGTSSCRYQTRMLLNCLIHSAMKMKNAIDISCTDKILGPGIVFSGKNCD
jgi:hypothetical protein